MPELVEVEQYRRLAERVVARTIAAVEVPDAWYVKDGTSPRALKSILMGKTVSAARRIGKLLLLDTDGPTIGLRFGMTGRLVVDGVVGIDELIYASARTNPEWDRFGMSFTDGGRLAVNDPRRLGGVALDPPEAALGPDAKAVTLGQLRTALHSDAPLKARLMTQQRLAGVGNLIADELLWRSGLAPARAARSLTDGELRDLHRHLKATLRDLQKRGGSHTGELMAHRKDGGRCPRDGTPLRRSTVAGRTTWSCPEHQK